MQQNTRTFPALIDERILPGLALRHVVLVIAGSLIIAASAKVALPIPFSPVPMTLQPLAVLLVGAALGSVRGFAAALLYLLEGISGLPFFAAGVGPAALIGPTGGYLMAFPFAAGLAGFFGERGWMRPVPAAIASLTFSLSLLYLSGWGWLVSGLRMDPEVAFAAGVLPFLLADIIKVILAALLLPSIHRLLERD